jgi:hypothetical protein
VGDRVFGLTEALGIAVDHDSLSFNIVLNSTAAWTLKFVFASSHPTVWDFLSLKFGEDVCMIATGLPASNEQRLLLGGDVLDSNLDVLECASLRV